jgi:hypothetical protein
MVSVELGYVQSILIIFVITNPYRFALRQKPSITEMRHLNNIDLILY